MGIGICDPTRSESAIGALGMTGRDARGHRDAGLKTAATTAKRRGADLL